MSRTLTAAREIQRNSQAVPALLMREFMIRAANAVVMCAVGRARDGVATYRTYEQLRAQGVARTEALKGVRVDSGLTKLLWK